MLGQGAVCSTVLTRGSWGAADRQVQVCRGAGARRHQVFLALWGRAALLFDGKALLIATLLPPSRSLPRVLTLRSRGRRPSRLRRRLLRHSVTPVVTGGHRLSAGVGGRGAGLVGGGSLVGAGGRLVGARAVGARGVGGRQEGLGGRAAARHGHTRDLAYHLQGLEQRSQESGRVRSQEELEVRKS